MYAQRGQGGSVKSAFAYKGEGVPANVYERNTTAAMNLTTPKIQKIFASSSHFSACCEGVW